MPSVTHTIRMRTRLRAQEQRSPFLKLGLGCSGVIGLALALVCVFMALSYADVTRGLPNVEALPTLLDSPGGRLLQPTRLYDRSGEHLLLTLQNPAAQGWRYLTLAAQPSSPAAAGDFLPSGLISATLAASDPGFWGQSGFSLFGVLSGSHPTLAQRLASNFLLQDEPPSLRRNLRERLLAAQLTSRFGRQKVLEWYLNSADFGRLTHGADAAARVYFGKPAGRLSLAEEALLATIAGNPSLNPVDAPQAALQRQKGVVQAMLRNRMISPEQGVQAAREALVVRRPEPQEATLGTPGQAADFAPAFIQLALRQLETQAPRSQIERGGLRVLTTLDYDLQTQVACAAAMQLYRLQNPAVENSTAEDSTPKAAAPVDCDASRLLPTLTFPDTPQATGLPAESLSAAGLSADAVALDPLTGQVLALLSGGPAIPDSAPLDSHPAGSLASPFIYLSAFTRGLSPASLVWDVPPATGLSTSPQDPTEAQNFDGAYHGPMRVRLALANDYPAPADKVLAEVGADNALRLASQLGIAFPEAPTESKPGVKPDSLTLLREVNLLEASQAFGIFAGQGLLAGRPLQGMPEPASAPGKVNGAATSDDSPRLAPLEPVSVLRVEDVSGKTQFDWSATQTRPILGPQLAYLMTNVLSDETARWPSLGHPNPLEIGRPAAAKLSRNASGESNWAIGYTPQRVVGVWLGVRQAQGGMSAPASLPEPAAAFLQTATAGLWHALAQTAHRDLPYQDWSEPSGLSHLQVCDPSGLLPTGDCPNVVDEVFLPGNEPSQVDTIYRTLEVNRETHRLATVFTPPDLVEARPFFLTPPEAEGWAKQSNLEAPPTDYDTLPDSLTSFTSTQIISPTMFAAVSGQTPIYGTAAGKDFVSYRIEVGQGLDPQDWFLVGQDVTHTVQGGQLGLWDTKGLSGLYAVQVLVVRQDQSLERATRVVTVDNQPPEVQIVYPAAGEEIAPGKSQKIVLQTSVDDDLGLQSVAFTMDGQLFATLTQGPYGLSWETTPGTHSLRVKATDLAGNSSEGVATFTVK